MSAITLHFADAATWRTSHYRFFTIITAYRRDVLAYYRMCRKSYRLPAKDARCATLAMFGIEWVPT